MEPYVIVDKDGDRYVYHASDVMMALTVHRTQHPTAEPVAAFLDTAGTWV